MAGLVVCVDCVFRQKLEHSVPGKAQGQFFSATDVARVSAAHPGAFGCYPNLRASVIPRVRCAYPGYAVAIFLHSGCAQSMEKAVDKPVQALCCNTLGAMVNISPAFPDAPRCFPTKATRTAKRMHHPVAQSAAISAMSALRPTASPQSRCASPPRDAHALSRRQLPGCAALTRATTPGDPNFRAESLLHSGCVQWMEKAVDKPAQPLRDKGFKNVVKI